MSSKEIDCPDHYTSGEIECIDAIRSALTHEELIGYLRGQIFRYNWRLNMKDTPLKNAGKANQYMIRLVSEVQEDNYIDVKSPPYPNNCREKK